MAAPFGDTAPALSRDGLELFYEHHSTADDWEIYRAVRTSLNVAFTTSELVPLTAARIHGDPELSDDGRTLYFTVLVGGDFRIYVATRDPT